MRFRNFVIQNFPFLEDDFDALTDYQLFCKMVAYVKKLYINNEKLLKEITANLEQMYEDGKFDSLIEEIVNLQTTFTFDTVSDMKLATNLVDGCYTKTLGYNTLNDGGNAYYKIRYKEENETADEKFIIELDDENLVAELLYKNKLNVNQVGIFGDGVTDVIDDLNIVMSKSINEIYLPHGTYLISKQLVFGNNNMALIGENQNNTTIKVADGTSDQVTYTSYIASTNKNNIEIGNLKIDSGEQTVSKYIISLIQGSNIKAHDLEICNGFGYATRFNDTNNLQVSNIYVHDINGFDEVSGGIYGMNMHKVRIEHIRGEKLGDHLLYITGDNDGHCNDIYINDIEASQTGMDELTNGSAITIYGNTYNVNISNVIVTNSTQAINITEHGETLQCPYDITITNVVAKNNKYDAVVIRGHDGNLCDSIILTNFTIDGCGQDAFGIRYSSNITINNNIVKNVVRYGVDLRHCENVIIQNNNFIDSNVGIRSSEYSEGALISNNNGMNTSGSTITPTYGLIVGDTSTKHKTYNNYFNDYTVSNYLIRGTTNKSILQANNASTTSDVVRSVYYGTAVGTTQEGQVGDILFNTNPSAGGNIGWVCVEAGTPGTWKTFGTIQD